MRSRRQSDDFGRTVLFLVAVAFLLIPIPSLFKGGSDTLSATLMMFVGICMMPLLWERLVARRGWRSSIAQRVRWGLCIFALACFVLVEAGSEAGPPSSASSPSTSGGYRDSQRALAVFDIHGLRIGRTPNAEFVRKHCPTFKNVMGRQFCFEDIKVRGQRVNVTYDFFDKKLIAVTLLFPSRVFPDLLDIYANKLSPVSASIEESALQTRIGANYTNIRATWPTSEGDFFITRYGTSVEYGHASIKTPLAIQLDEKSRDKRVRSLEQLF